MGGIYTVVVRARDGAEATYTFSQSSVHIGRASRNDIVLPRRRVSDRHAVIYRRGRRFIVMDLASTHGTWVKGRRISQPTVVLALETVELGGFELRFHMGPPRSEAAIEGGWSSDLMPGKQRLEALREALYGERTEGAWLGLCALLDEWPEDDGLRVGLDYAEQLLAGWPDALRRAPDLWKRPLLEGHPNPRFRIVRRLDLSYHVLGIRGVEALGRMPALERLTMLALRTTFLDDEGVEALLALPTLSGLRSLDLSHNRVGDRGALVLAQASRLSNLERLVLDTNPLTGAGVQALVSSPCLRNLLALDLSHTWGGTQIASVLVAMADLPRLIELRLAGTGLGADGAHLLAQAPCLSTVQTLDLTGNRLEDQGLNALSLTPIDTPLESLDLSDNNITDVGALALASSPSFGRLLRLKLSGNHLTPRGVQALASSPHLRRLQTLEL